MQERFFIIDCPSVDGSAFHDNHRDIIWDVMGGDLVTVGRVNADTWIIRTLLTQEHVEDIIENSDARRFNPTIRLGIADNVQNIIVDDNANTEGRRLIHEILG